MVEAYLSDDDLYEIADDDGNFVTGISAEIGNVGIPDKLGSRFLVLKAHADVNDDITGIRTLMEESGEEILNAMGNKDLVIDSTQHWVTIESDGYHLTITVSFELDYESFLIWFQQNQ